MYVPNHQVLDRRPMPVTTLQGELSLTLLINEETEACMHTHTQAYMIYVYIYTHPYTH